MKKTFLIITALLFITSTAFPQSKVNVNSLKEYGGKAFKVDDDEPYTGRVFDLNKRTGKKTLQGQYKKGLKTGKWSYWDENGRKYKEKDYSNDIDTDIWTYIDKDGSRYKGGMGATEAISVIGNIDNAAMMYYQTYGEWPTYVEELENSGQLAVDRSTKRKWIFELQLSGQGGRIIATSTGDMDGGEGRVVAFDRESGDYRGYGTTERGTKKNGELLLWYDDEKTQIKYFKSYKDGKEDGLHIEWHENGQKYFEGTYKDGELNGLWTDWYENGQKGDEGTYKDGKLDGLWTSWYENGQKYFEGTYKDGELNGLWTYYYENGQKKEEVTYRDGELISEKCWDEDGDEKECD